MNQNPNQNKPQMDLEDASASPPTETEIYEGINYDRNTWLEEVRGDTQFFLGKRYGNTLFAIEKMVKHFAKTGKPPFQITERKGKVLLTKNATAKYYELLSAFRAEYKQDIDYSPLVTVFFDELKKHQLMEVGWMGGPLHVMDQTNPKTNAERFNDLAADIKKAANSRKVKCQIYAREWNSIRNYREAAAYVDNLFEWYSRLLVCRIDLGYRRLKGNTVSVADAAKDLQRFFNNSRCNKAFEALVGKIWKLEVGEEKGAHFHLVLFFDGSKVQKDAYIAQKIGEYWSREITSGAGIFYNCNRALNKYKRIGIGKIHHSDSAKRANLMHAISYLTKIDQYLRYKPTRKTRSFGKGNMLGPRKGKLGRPRSVYLSEADTLVK